MLVGRLRDRRTGLWYVWLCAFSSDHQALAMMTISVHRSDKRAQHDYERLRLLHREPNPNVARAHLQRLAAGSTADWHPMPKHLSQRQMREIVQDALKSYIQHEPPSAA